MLGKFFLGLNQKFSNTVVNSINSEPSVSNLNKMFRPKSIAIVGASSDEKKLGAIVLKNIIDSGFKGEIFPLNLKTASILGLKTYKYFDDLPEIPDLALIAIPAKFVIESIEKILEKGTNNIVIFSAGFKEAGKEGALLEQQLLDVINKHREGGKNNINILGPNCLGFVNNLAPINATFGQMVKNKGNLRFISQSGAIASSVFDWAENSEIGFSEFVTLGNKTDLNENHILNYFLHNEIDLSVQASGSSGLAPIGMYLESIIDGKEFINISRKISQNNPIFLLKPGKSNESKLAMQSHTGSIAGEDYVLDVALKKAGVIRCDGIEDFFDLARVFSWEKIPKGKNVAIISNAGGPAVMSSDFIASEGLKLVRFDEETRMELEKHLPRAASILNPVDVLGDALAERYENAIKTLIVDDDVHSLIIILTPQVMTQIEETAEVIGRLSIEYGKPIICSFMGGSHIVIGEKVLNRFKIPSFRFPERAVKAVARMIQWGEFRDSFKSNNSMLSKVDIEPLPEIVSNEFVSNEFVSNDNSILIETALSGNRKTLDSFEVDGILRSFGVTTPSSMKCKTIEDAKSFVRANNFPVVLKVSSPTMLHKSDEGGVIVGIDSNEKLESAFENLSKIINILDKSSNLENSSNLNFIQIQKQVSKGLELIIGSKKDKVFGYVLMFGAGGVLANLIEDRNLSLIPIDKQEAISLVKSSKVNKLIQGYRGEKAYDSDKIIDLILKFQRLIIANPKISEMDINPVILNDDGIWAVDGKIILL